MSEQQVIPSSERGGGPVKRRARFVKWLIRGTILFGVVWGISAFVNGARADLAKEEFAWDTLQVKWLVLAGVFYAVGLFPACWFWRRILLSLG